MSDLTPTPDERIAAALESIARNLEKLAKPPMMKTGANPDLCSFPGDLHFIDRSWPFYQRVYDVPPFDLQPEADE